MFTSEHGGSLIKHNHSYSDCTLHYMVFVQIHSTTCIPLSISRDCYVYKLHKPSWIMELDSTPLKIFKAARRVEEGSYCIDRLK